MEYNNLLIVAKRISERMQSFHFYGDYNEPRSRNTSDQVPCSWKIANIHLVPKTGGLSDPANYRPIENTSEPVVKLWNVFIIAEVS